MAKSFTDIGKSCLSRKFLTSQIISFNAIRENKIPIYSIYRKSDLTPHWEPGESWGLELPVKCTIDFDQTHSCADPES